MKKYQVSIIAFCALLIFGCSQATQQQAQSPMEVLKALNQASKNKDVPTIKNSVSKGTLQMIGESAKAQNMSVDDFLKKDTGAVSKDLPEMRNEKIEGDKATVELKDAATENWESVPFVREDGVWRLALDKYMEDSRRRATENMKMSAENNNANSSAAVSDADQKPKEAANKPAKNKK